MHSDPVRARLLALAAATATAIGCAGCREATAPAELRGWVLTADASLGTSGQGRFERCALQSTDFTDNQGTLPVYWAGLPVTSFSRLVTVNATVQRQVELPFAVALVAIEQQEGDSVRVVYSGQLMDTLYGRRLSVTRVGGEWACASTLPGGEPSAELAKGQWSLEKR